MKLGSKSSQGSTLNDPWCLQTIFFIQIGVYGSSKFDYGAKMVPRKVACEDIQPSITRTTAPKKLKRDPKKIPFLTFHDVLRFFSHYQAKMLSFLPDKGKSRGRTVRKPYS